MTRKYRTKSTIDQAKAERNNPFSRLGYYSALDKAKKHPATLSRALRPKHIFPEPSSKKCAHNSKTSR
jgi:hypothetical protein